MKWLSLCGAAFTLGACATASPPSIHEIGVRPRPEFDPEPQIRAIMERHLKDPYSAQYRRVGGPVPGKTQEPLLAGGRVVSGWGYCYMVNAKNSFGAYAGYQPYYFVVKNDAVIGWAQNAQLSSWNCF